MNWAQVVDCECAPTFQDYVAVESTLAVAGELTKEDIVSIAKTHDGEQDGKQEENIMEEEGPLPDPVASCEAMSAIDTLTRYLW